MTSVKPLYDAVRATVLDGLRREWQRYGWEDSEIDDKVDKLAKLWAAALHSTGAVTDTTQPQQRAEAAEEEKGEVGADGKRKRKREEKPGEKRFKSGPRVDAPLTYPTFPPAAATAAAAPTYAPQPAALPSGYVPRFPSPMPSLSPAPPPTPLPTSAPSTSAPPRDAAVREEEKTAHSAAARSVLTATSSSSLSATESTIPAPHSPAPQSLFSPSPSSVSSQTVKAELYPLPLPPSLTFSASSSTDNPLLTEPLSSLDDDSDVDVELAAVKDLILCQYERVAHQKGRWKVAMRDGIVNVKGKEYAFSRMTGELQW